MADVGNGRNGDGERMRAIAENVKLQAWARLSMVTAPPIMGALVAITCWFFSQLVGEVKATRETVNAYITADTAEGARTHTKLREHERRLGNLEGKVFGFTPSPVPRDGQ